MTRMDIPPEDEGEPKRYECDCCGRMTDVDKLSTFFYPPVGDTTACEECRGVNEP